VMPTDPPVNTGGPDLGREPQVRVSGMQAKLHRWAAADSGRRFDDLFNFMYDRATLHVAFVRVAGVTPGRTPRASTVCGLPMFPGYSVGSTLSWTTSVRS